MYLKPILLHNATDSFLFFGKELIEQCRNKTSSKQYTGSLIYSIHYKNTRTFNDTFLFCYFIFYILKLILRLITTQVKRNILCCHHFYFTSQIALPFTNYYSVLHNIPGIKESPRKQDGLQINYDA